LFGSQRRKTRVAAGALDQMFLDLHPIVRDEFAVEKFFQKL
jgi:hypothetical protein